MRRGPRELRRELSRRDFLRVAASAGAVGAGAVLLGACGADDGNGSATSTPGIVVDPPPETTTIRLANQKELFQPRNAPLYFAEQFLAAEGFTSVQYIDVPRVDGPDGQLAAGAVDIGIPEAWSVTVAADAGDQLVILAGVQNSAFVIVGNDRVQSVQDLKGKRIWALTRDTTDASYTLMAALLSYVGIDVETEVEFVLPSAVPLITQFLEGSVDAGYLIRPYSTLFRNANIGHVVLDGMVDPPWSQYFGSMATANRDFVEKHPVATKRALRAILKATDVCAREPERVARYLIEQGITTFAYEQALDAIPGVSFAAWREFDPEDTVRFYALRLKEAGLVKSTPEELIARATDWRLLDELKRELAVA